MTTQNKLYRYQLPQKAVKGDCPQCGPKHRKTLSRYLDTRTGELLPEIYGRCDRESNCGYSLSPYTKGSSGLSYADEIYQASRDQSYTMKPHHLPKVLPKPVEKPIYSLPDEVVTKSLTHYRDNQFYRLLLGHFGGERAKQLIEQFQVGTSRCWNNAGACVFWLIDEKGRTRGGQIKLFDDSFHTVKYTDRNGQKRSRTSWVHSVLAYQYDKAEKPRPDWLTNYIDRGEFAPCLFGLPQLLHSPKDQPIAIVEAPKTAVLCTPYFPQFIWIAVVGRSYLNAERLAPIRNRHIVLFPDLAVDGKDYQYWLSKAESYAARALA